MANFFGGGNGQVVPTRYNGIRLTQALLGQPFPYLWGTRRLSAKLLWYGDFTSSVATNGGKKGGGSGGGIGGKKGGQQYVYSASVVAALCMGDCQGLLSVWDSTGKFAVASYSESFTVPGGGGSYQVLNASQFNTDQGPALQSPYSVTVDDFGSPGSTTLSGTQGVPMTLVLGSPSSGEYSLDEATGTYTFSPEDAGVEVIVNYSAYRWTEIEEFLTVVPFSPPYQVTVENQPNFAGDSGVKFYPSGVALTAVGGTPTLTGTYNPNAGNYLFAPVDAGKGVAISYAFNIPSASQDLNAPSTLNLTFISGAKSQAPWSYLTTKHPNEALGYTQICYIASSGLYLGFVPELPDYNYEIVGPRTFGGGVRDACLCDCIEDVLTDGAIGIGFPAQFIDDSLQGLTRAFWLANNFFGSPLVESYVTVASLMGDWLEAGQVGCFWSEGLFKFVPYGTSSAIANGAQYTPPTQPLISLSDSDFIAGKKAPIKVTRKPWQDAYNRVGVQWSVRENDYNSDVTPEQDDAAIARYGRRPERAKNFDFICEQPAAIFASNMRLQRYVYIRNTYTFSLDASFAWLEPMDIVEVTDTRLGLNATAVRVLKIVDDPKKGIAVTAEDFPWASGSPTLYTKQDVQPSGLPLPGQALPGDTSLVLVETPNPNSLHQGSILSVFAAGLSSNWGGCILQKAVGTNSCPLITTVQISSGGLFVTGANDLQPDDIVTFFDLGPASFLNGKTVTVVTASPTGFTASFAHADYGPIADDGSAWAMTAFTPFAAVVKPARIGVLSPLPNPIAAPVIPSLSTTFGGSTPPGVYYVVITYTGPSGESLPSPEASATIVYSFFFSTKLVVFSPPAVAGATGWNVYVSNSSGIETRQNSSPIAIGTFWSQPALVAGAAPPPSYALPAYGGSNPEYAAGSSPAALESVGVDMLFPGAILEGISDAAASGPYPVTLAAIIPDTSNGGALEMLSYQNAVLESGSLQPGSRYSISGLYRGLLGTDGTEHFPGDLFVRMDDASATYDYDPSLYGKTIFVLATSFNTLGGSQQNQADGVTYKILLQGTEWVGGSTAHSTYRPADLTLTGHDTGTVPEVIVSDFFLKVPGLQDIAVNGGTIFATNADYGKLAYLYYDDPSLQGGTVAFNITFTKEVALEGLGRIFIGSIYLPLAGGSDTIGNNDGGSGAQYGKLNQLQFQSVDLSHGTGGTVTNPQYAIGAVPGQYADINVTSPNIISNNPELDITASSGINRGYYSANVVLDFEVPVNTLTTAGSDWWIEIRDRSPYLYVPTNLLGRIGVVEGGFTLSRQVQRLPIPLGLNLGQLFAAAFFVQTSTGSVEIKIHNLYIEAFE